MPRADTSLREQLRSRALELGFHRVGFAAATELPRAEVLARWIDRGMHGGMRFIANAIPPRHDPRHLLPTARTVIVAAIRYASGQPDPPTAPGQGRIARYARGQDYHQVVRARLERLGADLADLAGPVQWRAVVDSAPLLEREAAVAAGIGFIGKNTLLIAPGIGSYTVLGELLVDLELPPDRPLRTRCGDCNRCLSACPTGAIISPRVVDARRCISYLTIEHRGSIDQGLWGQTADWIFGCDRCQEVCPFNAETARKLALPRDQELAPPLAPALVPLAELLTMRAGAYRRLTRGRALRRAPAAAWRRNAALAALAELSGDPASPADPALVGALRAAAADRDQAVRELARRALAPGRGSDR